MPSATRPTAVVHPQKRHPSPKSGSRILPATATITIDQTELDVTETPVNQTVTPPSSPAATRSYSSSDDDDLGPATQQVQTAPGSPLPDDVSQLPYYYGSLSSSQAKDVLRDADIGTFIVRDSFTQPDFPLAISFVVSHGPPELGATRVTSVRITRSFTTGLYRLDCTDEHVRAMPVFRTVAELVEFLVQSSSLTVSSTPPTAQQVNDVTTAGTAQRQRRRRQRCVLTDQYGNVEQRLTLRQPLLISDQ